MDPEVRQRLVQFRQDVEAWFVVIMALVCATVAILYFSPRVTGVALPQVITDWLARWQMVFWLLASLALAIVIYEGIRAIYRFFRYGDHPDFFY